MEEETLLRERLQAITDKRRLREEIEKKRRNIEEEKLKLQYLKKKTLREQWLMDGLSTLSEEEQESAKAQTEDNQQQAKLLQSNIDRIETEIVALETQELEISAKEETLLKQLKEVEKTSEDIIKEFNVNIQPEPIQYIYTAIPDVPKCYTPTTKRIIFTPKHETDDEQEKKATFTMKFSVEKDLRTGESHILSTATITPEDLQPPGIKVYDDGQKSVYALPPDGLESQNGMNEMSPLEVEELLLKASEKKVSTDVVYHEPVFSSPFSRPTTPQKTASGYISLNGLQMSSKSQSPFQTETFTKQEDRSPKDGKQSPTHIPTTKSNQYFGNNQQAQNITNGPIINSTGGEYRGATRIGPTSSPTQECGENLRITPTADSGLGFGRYSPLNPKEDSSLNLVNTLPPDVERGEPVTMIFMGYQNVESDEEDEAIQAELVVIGDDVDDEDGVVDEDTDAEDAPLSYHPLGYYSKVFKPNNTVYRSEIRPCGVRTYSYGGRTFGNEIEDAVATVLPMKLSQLGKYM
ncbi:palmdelphin-like isoform X4 [Myxocyprinus asiaticus]|uniref:palmdelphin-like isoform X4 n=1 Tax=Myxocyprinus asiaticus TaxID=70543 RepID=UPI002221E771|nr:palmdelphin-like isoform X4 [Myxocyprinus asiaticus]